MSKTLFQRTVLATLALTSSAVWAHTGELGHVHASTSWQALAQAMAHPFSGLDHLVAMVSVGAWSALRRRQGATASPWAVPMAFVMLMLLGAGLGLAGWQVPGVEPLVAASVLILGLLMATRAVLPQAMALGLVALFALGHGLAHGAELPAGQAALMLGGMAASTLLLHGVGMVCGQALSRAPSGLRLQRLLGLAVGALGTVLLVPALSGAL